MANLAESLDRQMPVHWVGDAPTSLHGNGASSFKRTTRNADEVTCRLCLTLLSREMVRLNAGEMPGATDGSGLG